MDSNQVAILLDLKSKTGTVKFLSPEHECLKPENRESKNKPIQPILVKGEVLLPQFMHLDPSMFKVLFLLSCLQSKYGAKSKSIRVPASQLVESTGLAISTVKRCVYALTEKGYIQVLENDYKFGNTYRVVKSMVQE